MNKSNRCMLLLVVLFVAVTTAWSADQLVSMYVGGKKVDCNPAARVHDGITYAPLRAAAEAVGAHVQWSAATQTVTICTENQCVQLKASQGIMVNNSLLIPVRLMGEALGRKVAWDSAANAVRIQ